MPLPVTANGSYYGQTSMIDAGGSVGDGQDGQIQFDRLEFESPEDLMRHLYYTCMRPNASEPPWTTDAKYRCELETFGARFLRRTEREPVAVGIKFTWQLKEKKKLFLPPSEANRV
uniref:Uncharacterized protein n=1 Tax=Anopheles maculatus TaxID=74869 RepID=A0A182SFP3_9DIPT